MSKEKNKDSDKKETPEPSFKDAPAAHEGKVRTEEGTMKGKMHGRDETGAPAPDQVDQTLINEEKHQASKEGRHGEMHDRRWPPMDRAMGVVPPADDERVAELREVVQADDKEAEKNRKANEESAKKAAASREKK